MIILSQCRAWRKTQFAAALLLLLVVFGCHSEKRFSLEEIPPVILAKNDKEIFQYWEFPNIDHVWSLDLNELKGIQQYRDSLKEFLGEERYEQAILKEATVSNALKKEIYSDNSDRKNSELIHDGTLGKIRKINVLESELLNYQANRYPLFSHPTEFHAFILVQDSLDLVRVYFCSSDQPWPPKPKVLRVDIDKKIQQGWRLKYHLHNHFEDEETDYVGVMAPSLADAHYFQMLDENYSVEKTLITNGFNTVEMGPEDFDKFEIE